MRSPCSDYWNDNIRLGYWIYLKSTWQSGLGLHDRLSFVWTIPQDRAEISYFREYIAVNKEWFCTPRVTLHLCWDGSVVDLSQIWVQKLYQPLTLVHKHSVTLLHSLPHSLTHSQTRIHLRCHLSCIVLWHWFVLSNVKIELYTHPSSFCEGQTMHLGQVIRSWAMVDNNQATHSSLWKKLSFIRILS